MSNSNNSFSDLLDQLVSKRSGNIDASEFVRPLLSSTSLTAKSASTSLKNSSIGLKSLSEGSSEKLQSIQFGKPSSNSTSSSSSGSVWQSLLSQTASGGLSSALGGGLGSIVGLGGLVSSITNLFGGSAKAAPPPLVLFSLPDSIQQTAYVSSKGASVYAGDSVEKTLNPTANSAIYTSTGIVRNSSQASAPVTTDSTSIAQAVKTALLSSSTLGDVIAEI